MSTKPTSPIQGSVTVSGSSQPSSSIVAQNTAASASSVRPSDFQSTERNRGSPICAERPGEVDDEAHASIQVVSAATSGRGRSGGGVAQVPR